ncbi:hypothetical protein [Candidatus Berkiella aquae]|uniref:Uncharacterized protein n=1 Tax=Candidatus Berkiella aquae TaxID=295108 RepID=A0A0Q9YJE2_9GAMM|nr:hypothetical protein [Candidatus Berkiella aquae]MCS5710679.1 hypothetical protein [Candidatus Berkiella aquae]
MIRNLRPLPKKRMSKRPKVSLQGATFVSYSPVEYALSLPEIVAIIASFCPLYSVRGKNNLMTVSKLWHKVISESDFYDNVSFRNLIKDCLKSPEGVIYILRDEKLLPYLTKERLLELIGCHKEFALHLLENEIMSGLCQYDLFRLASHHHEVGLFILKNEKYRKEFSDVGVSSLGHNHPKIADYLFNTQPNILDLAINEKSHPDIVRQMLNHSDNFNRLYAVGIVRDVAFKYLDVLVESCKDKKAFEFLKRFEINTPADFIQNLINLFEGGWLNWQHLIYLGCHHAEIAINILKTPTLLENINPDVIIAFGRYHKSVAMHILTTEKIYKKLNGNNLFSVCNFHFEAIEYLFNQPELLKKISMFFIKFIAYKHPKIGLAILKTEDYFTQLTSSELECIGCSGNSAVIEHILLTSVLYNKLTIENLEKICRANPRVVRKILYSSHLHKEIEAFHLERLRVVNEYISQLPPVDIAFDVSRLAKLWNVEKNTVDSVVNATLAI